MSSAHLRILVPIETPDLEHPLIELASSIATPPEDELHLIHVVSPSSIHSSVPENSLMQMADRIKNQNIRALVHLESGHDVTEIIGRSVDRWSCNMMVMGWKADIERTAILEASNRSLTKNLDIDTLIFKERDFAPAQRILVPTGGGPHSILGIQIAHDLAQQWGSELEILRIARDNRCNPQDPLLHKYCEQLAQDTQLQLQLLNIDVPVRILPSADVVRAVEEQAKDRDLVVIGASNDWRQEEYLSGSIPDKIANRVPCSALMVRSAITSDLTLSSIFWEQMIRLDLRPTDKWDAINQMIEVLIEEQQFPSTQRQRVLQSALEREKKSSTGLGHATAIPHAPIPDLPGIIGCLGICPEGLDFESNTGEKVHFIFLLLTPQQNYRSYIPVLAQIASLVRNHSMQQALLNAQTPTEVTAHIKQFEMGK
tara:strand:+ start:1359 stop:2639 length:1281 start_codon:yes stop_codon:yes gene_type:complete